MKHIKTWSERCEEHPDHQERIITDRMIQARMQEEIDELRQALETDLARVGEVGVWGEWQGLTDDEVNELVARFKRYSYVLLREVEAKLKEKNGG
jgi:hypothetical protein